MIRVSVYYPNKAGAKFDHTYYTQKHAPMVIQRLKPFGLVRVEIDKGLAGGAPNAPAPNVAVGYMVFNKLEDFQKGLAAHSKEIMGDIPNYTNIEPVIQISEIAVG
jgi:uncharacterized protein (TIGR02118 family)